MDSFDSLTESTFILKPSKRSNATSSITANGGYVPLLQGKEPVECMELRRRLFEDTWPPLEKQLVEIEARVNHIGVSEVCEFVQSSYKQAADCEKGRPAQPFAEIAAAVAFAGVNTGDHGKLFCTLQEQLKEQGHHVALLESQYCGSLTSLHKGILEQMFASFYSEHDDATKQSSFSGSKSVPYDLNLLRLWWEDAVARDTANASRKMVVILQDFEGFPPIVVDDFIRIVAGYCNMVPLVLVLGLATSYECIHQSLTKASISMLNIERFNLQRSKQCIDTAIHDLFVRGNGLLSFGAEAYKSLLDQFLLYNFSIAGFIKKLKYAAMDFFYAQPLSILAQMLSAENGVLAVNECSIKLNPDHIELIRMQKSVQRFLEERAGKAGLDLHKALCSDEYLQNTVLPRMMRQLVAYRHGYSLGIAAVLEIQKYAPEALQKPIRTLHYYGLGQQFQDCTHWKTLLAVVRRMKTSEMAPLLKAICGLVDSSVSVDWTQLGDGENIPDFLHSAAQLLENPDNIAKVTTPTSTETSKRVRTRTDMEERPFLLFDSNTSDAQLQALERCCEAIEAMLKACLQSYHDVPLNEVFYYRHSFLLDATFSAQPRAAVQTALGRSHYYINCSCCSEAAQVPSGDAHASDDEDSRVLPTMHDTSIAYRLHQECGRLINLYDWHCAFSSVIEREPSRAAPSQAEAQARFMRSVEELRFLGFIKSTQRKTDHVVRLTWGM
ncbi:Origin recognition complex subunit 3 [Coemansia sp. RSA 2336]|nr:Origin recognition complex subunit 3 [Coemansia sp. RSA 2336]